jgi:hypothetical protein
VSGWRSNSAALRSRTSRRYALKLVFPTSSNARWTCRGELASARATTATVNGRR